MFIDNRLLLNFRKLLLETQNYCSKLGNDIISNFSTYVANTFALDIEQIRIVNPMKMCEVTIVWTVSVFVKSNNNSNVIRVLKY